MLKQNPAYRTAFFMRCTGNLEQMDFFEIHLGLKEQDVTFAPRLKEAIP
jgi:hypothetical protein